MRLPFRIPHPVSRIGMFLALFGFFILTFPANHSEAEDAYYYSLMAERGAWTEMFHAHHLLYLPLMRMVFCIAQWIGYSGRTFPVLAGISMISGAVSICLFAALLRRVRVKRVFAGALLFSYGFWRYSTTVEIYAPVMALSLLAIYCAVRGAEQPFFRGSVLAGSFALLVHLAAIPAALLAIPSLYLFRGQRSQAARYVFLTLLFVAAVYGGVVACGIRPVVFSDVLVQRGTLLEPLTWIKALVAWGQTVCSGNFLFAIPFVAGRLAALFPSNMLQEEFFMGRQAPLWVSFSAPVSAGLVLGLFAGFLGAVARCAKRISTVYSAEFFSALIWLAGAASMSLCFEPANPEIWICALPPFWLLAGQIWDAVPDRRGWRWLPTMMVAALFLHNWIGGMSLVKSPDGDYCRQKGVWIIGQARHDDLILTADSHSFVTFLEYQTQACVLDVKFAGPDLLSRMVQQAGGQVFVFSDVIDLLPPVAHRAPQSVTQMHAAAERLRPGLHPVHSNSFGMVYEWSGR